jgi:hypothetical protein
MMTLRRAETLSDTWNGKNRRNRYDRRMGSDRRTLIRFESIGCDRRLGTPRRRDEMLWEKDWFTRNDIH